MTKQRENDQKYSNSELHWGLLCSLYVKDLFCRLKKRVGTGEPLLETNLFRPYPNLHVFPVAVKTLPQLAHPSLSPSGFYMLLNMSEILLDGRKAIINQSIRKSTNPRKCLFLAFQKIYNSFWLFCLFLRQKTKISFQMKKITFAINMSFHQT